MLLCVDDGVARAGQRTSLPRAVALALMMMAGAASAQTAPELLFHVSADRGFTADTAHGDAIPNFQDKVKRVPDGEHGSAIQWEDDGVLSWNAPGNIQAQRGTLGFYWRPATRWVKRRS